MHCGGERERAHTNHTHTRAYNIMIPTANLLFQAIDDCHRLMKDCLCLFRLQVVVTNLPKVLECFVDVSNTHSKKRKEK